MNYSDRYRLSDFEQNSTITCWWHQICRTPDIHVVHVDLSENTEREEIALFMLDQLERKRACAFYCSSTRRQFVLSRAALRANLCTQLDVDNSDLKIFAERNEKPTATVGKQPLSIQFNVSHTVDHGLLAFAVQGRIGVDVENRTCRPNIDEILYSVFSPKEQLMLRQTPEPKRRQLFFRLWTFKEALIKATGEGFRRDTSAFSIPEDILGQTRSARMQLGDMPEVVWKIVNLETNHYAAAVAHEHVES